MKIYEFKEKAKKGGWKCKNDWGDNLVDIPFEQILLDPKAWQAVGKVEGWGDSDIFNMPFWKLKMHDMIDALCEGKSIEEFIKTL